MYIGPWQEYVLGKALAQAKLGSRPTTAATADFPDLPAVYRVSRPGSSFSAPSEIGAGRAAARPQHPRPSVPGRARPSQTGKKQRLAQMQTMYGLRATAPGARAVQLADEALAEEGSEEHSRISAFSEPPQPASTPRRTALAPDARTTLRHSPPAPPPPPRAEEVGAELLGWAPRRPAAGAEASPSGGGWLDPAYDSRADSHSVLLRVPLPPVAGAPPPHGRAPLRDERGSADARHAPFQSPSPPGSLPTLGVPSRAQLAAGPEAWRREGPAPRALPAAHPADDSPPAQSQGQWRPHGQHEAARYGQQPSAWPRAEGSPGRPQPRPRAFASGPSADARPQPQPGPQPGPQQPQLPERVRTANSQTTELLEDEVDDLIEWTRRLGTPTLAGGAMAFPLSPAGSAAGARIGSLSASLQSSSTLGGAGAGPRGGAPEPYVDVFTLAGERYVRLSAAAPSPPSSPYY